MTASFLPRIAARIALSAGLLVLTGPPRAGAAEPGSPDKAAQALQVAQEGARAREKGELAVACALFTQAVKLVPVWATAHFELARCLRLVGDLEGAAAHLKKADAKLGGQGTVHVERAKQAEDRGDRGAAWTHYAAAQTVSPADVRAMAGAARTAAPGAAALERLRKLVARQPMNAAAWQRLADVAEEVGRLDEAEAALVKVLELSHYKARAAAALGRFGQRHGRKSAMSLASKALAR